METPNNKLKILSKILKQALKKKKQGSSHQIEDLSNEELSILKHFLLGENKQLRKLSAFCILRLAVLSLNHYGILLRARLFVSHESYYAIGVRTNLKLVKKSEVGKRVKRAEKMVDSLLNYSAEKPILFFIKRLKRLKKYIDSDQEEEYQLQANKVFSLTLTEIKICLKKNFMDRIPDPKRYIIWCYSSMNANRGTHNKGKVVTDDDDENEESVQSFPISQTSLRSPRTLDKYERRTSSSVWPVLTQMMKKNILIAEQKLSKKRNIFDFSIRNFSKISYNQGGLTPRIKHSLKKDGRKGDFHPSRKTTLSSIHHYTPVCRQRNKSKSFKFKKSKISHSNHITKTLTPKNRRSQASMLHIFGEDSKDQLKIKKENNTNPKTRYSSIGNPEVENKKNNFENNLGMQSHTLGEKYSIKKSSLFRKRNKSFQLKKKQERDSIDAHMTHIYHKRNKPPKNFKRLKGRSTFINHQSKSKFSSKSPKLKNSTQSSRVTMLNHNSPSKKVKSKQHNYYTQNHHNPYRLFHNAKCTRRIRTRSQERNGIAISNPSIVLNRTQKPKQGNIKKFLQSSLFQTLKETCLMGDSRLTSDKQLLKSAICQQKASSRVSFGYKLQSYLKEQLQEEKEKRSLFQKISKKNRIRIGDT